MNFNQWINASCVFNQWVPPTTQNQAQTKPRNHCSLITHWGEWLFDRAIIDRKRSRLWLCEEDPKAFQGVRLPLYWPGLEHVGITGRINARGFASLHTMLKLRRYPNQNPISRGKGELKLTLIRCISCLLGGEVLLRDYTNVTYENSEAMMRSPLEARNWLKFALMAVTTSAIAVEA